MGAVLSADSPDDNTKTLHTGTLDDPKGTFSITKRLGSLSGTRLCAGRVDVQEMLGAGGQGVVFRVRRCPSEHKAGKPSESLPSVQESQLHFMPRAAKTPDEAALKV